MSDATRRVEIRRKADQVQKALLGAIDDRERLALVKAPPGSGKTWLLLKGAARAFALKRRVAIATQTNTQADDICERFARDYAGVQVIRFAGRQSAPREFGPNVTWETSSGRLPVGPCVVVATSAKWGLVNVAEPFDILFVEEAWQMAWADLMLLGKVSERFVLIGDPGQIPPVVTIDVSRWETAGRPPHSPAPDRILREGLSKPLTLPASRRLPFDAVKLVQPFYDFDFGAYAAPGDRALLVDGRNGSAHDRAIESLAGGSVAAITVPTPDHGPPVEEDRELAEHAARLVKRLLHRGARVRIDGKVAPLEPAHIGICATHRAMNAAVDLALPQELRGEVIVDTPERWQGLERPVMIIIHPLSGVLKPSEFDLETGRLCVMASRHQVAMFVLARDHVADTLGSTIPSASQPLGRADITGRGLKDNLTFWETLESGGRVVCAK